VNPSSGQDISLHPDVQEPDASNALAELAKALRAIPDPPTPAGTRHCLDALLSLLIVGTCCGCHSVEAVLDVVKPRMALRE